MVPTKHYGHVTTGKGEGKRRTRSNWFTATLEKEYGIVPYPGTLNLIGVSAFHKVQSTLLSYGTVLVPTTTETCCAILLPLRIRPGGPGKKKAGNRDKWHKALLIRPLVPNYRANQVEIISDSHLRTLFCLADGDRIEFEYDAEFSRSYRISGRRASKWISAVHRN